MSSSPVQSHYSNWELPFVKWAETNGYVMDYAVNSDLEFHPEILKQYRLVLSVGHDEYWSAPMRDHLEKYIADGGNDTIAGYECDGCEMTWNDGLPSPTHNDGTPRSFTILGCCPAQWAPDDCLWYDRFPVDRVGAAVLGIYTQGGTVVTPGTTDWAHGLRGNDPAVVKITRNVLDRLSK